MDISQKCVRVGCFYQRYVDSKNRIKSYCCISCRIFNTHAPRCEKKPFVLDKLIYCNASGGFNDIMVQLACVTEYAIKHNYTIIFKSMLYKSCKYADIFDFTNYPCKIYIDDAALTLIRKLRRAGFKEHTDTSASVFDLSKIYSPELILVRRRMGGKANLINNKSFEPLSVFRYLRLNPTFKELVLAKLCLLPKLFYGVQIRNTDHWAKPDSLLIDKYLTTLTDQPIVLATDNKETLNTLCDQYTNIIPTGSLDNIESSKLSQRVCKNVSQDTCNTPVRYGSLHFTFGGKSDTLQNAILDILVIASAYEVKTTLDFGGNSGFSRLIRDIHNDKNLLSDLLS